MSRWHRCVPAPPDRTGRRRSAGCRGCAGGRCPAWSRAGRGRGGSARTPSIRTASATDRVRVPITSKSCSVSGNPPPRAMWPIEGLNPTRPVWQAGRRMEPPPVGADRRRHEAGGHARRRAAARPSGRQARVPRVAGRAEQAGWMCSLRASAPGHWSCRRSPRRPRAAARRDARRGPAHGRHRRDCPRSPGGRARTGCP